MINVSNTNLLTDGVRYALLAWSLHPEHLPSRPVTSEDIVHDWPVKQ